MAQRTRISDAQTGILEGFYKRGMVGTGTMYKEMVQNAETDTGLTKAQVQGSIIHVFDKQITDLRCFACWFIFMSHNLRFMGSEFVPGCSFISSYD